jgi:hypothetical protein
MAKSLGGQDGSRRSFLTESQLVVLEKTQETQEARGDIESEHPGYLDSQDSYYIGFISKLILILIVVMQQLSFILKKQL